MVIIGFIKAKKHSNLTESTLGQLLKFSYSAISLDQAQIKIITQAAIF